MHRYQNEADYWRIRNFLREVFAADGGKPQGWHVARFDYWRWHVIANCGVCEPIEQVTFYWEENGRIVALLNPEANGQAFFTVHPAWHRPELAAEMLDVAENYLRKQENGKLSLTIFTNTHDPIYTALLNQRRYQPQLDCEYHNWRSLDELIPDLPLPPGYTIRPLGDESELPARSQLSAKAFHPDDPELIVNAIIKWDWYLSVQRAPLYRRDLDLVVEAPNGDLAAFCTILPFYQALGFQTFIKLKPWRKEWEAK